MANVGQFREMWKRFRRIKTALFGLIIVFIVVGIAVFADFLAPYDPYKSAFKETLEPPSSKHIFGTDDLGRDLLSRILYGARTSLFVGVVASLISLAIGVSVGVFSGYYGGLVDALLMRVSDIFLSIPSYFLYILALAFFRTRSITSLALVLGFFMWPRLARIIRSEFLSLKERDFVRAARSIGAGNLSIAFRHILPNSIASLIVVSTLNVAIGVLMESALSFLGMGDPTVPSWGHELSLGRKYINTAWWLATFPGLAIFLTTLSINLVGDGLRDVLDPRLRGYGI